MFVLSLSDALLGSIGTIVVMVIGYALTSLQRRRQARWDKQDRAAVAANAADKAAGLAAKLEHNTAISEEAVAVGKQAVVAGEKTAADVAAIAVAVNGGLDQRVHTIMTSRPGAKLLTNLPQTCEEMEEVIQRVVDKSCPELAEAAATEALKKFVALHPGSDQQS